MSDHSNNAGACPKQNPRFMSWQREWGESILRGTMPVLVRFEKRKAFLRDGRWRSADVALEVSLNEATTRWIRETGGPSFSDSDQERSVAREMAERYEGRILLHSRSRSGRSAEVFLKQRQMTLEFGSALPMTRRAAAGR